jgi:hypothetical protein
VWLTWGFDRLARNFAPQVLTLEELPRSGVWTHYLDRGLADKRLSTLREITDERKPSKGTERDGRGKRHGTGCPEMISPELLSVGPGGTAGCDSTAPPVEIWESEAAITRKIFDTRSCLPAQERNNSADAASRGNGQRDFHSSKQRVE